MVETLPTNDQVELFFSPLTLDSGNENQDSSPQLTPHLVASCNVEVFDSVILCEEKKKPTPLAWGQLFICLLAMTVDPIWSTAMYPFLNKMILRLPNINGNENKVGYYAGLIDSCFYLTQALFIYQWNKLSGIWGRKPVMIIGLIGLFLSSAMFARSNTYWQGYVLSRCIAGLTNGNIGVTKNIASDITDESNISLASSVLFLDIPVGDSLGALIGGFLNDPHAAYPHVFTNSIWATYPWLLPYGVVAAISSISAAVVFYSFKETLTNTKPIKKVVTEFFQCSGPSNKSPEENKVELRTFWSLITDKHVMMPLLSYALVGMIDSAFGNFQPLFYTSLVSSGGLGIASNLCGLVTCAYCIVMAFFNFFILPRVIKAFSVKGVLIFAITMSFVMIIFFPIMSAVTAVHGVGMITWFLVALQILAYSSFYMSYGTTFIIITKTAPNQHQIGLINGIGQTLASFGRMCGPTATTYLWAVSRIHYTLNGQLVYYAWMGIVVIVWYISALCLPNVPNDEKTCKVPKDKIIMDIHKTSK